MRIRSCLAALMLLGAPAVHAWTGVPVLVDGVAVGPREVAAASDGAFGALIAWQEPGESGTLRVTHLLGDGSHDPAWPMGGMALASGGRSRVGLRAIADGIGGAYVLWQEDATLFLTRVLAAGGVAPGWTSRGRLLGPLTSGEHRAWAERDAAGGLYIGWFQGARSGFVTPSVRVIHVGPDGSGAGGWPSSARSLPLSPDHLEWVFAASFGVAEDGGVWVVVATGREEEAGLMPGEWRLARFQANGVLDPSRPREGTSLGEFDPQALANGPHVPRLSLAALAADGAGGVYTALGRIDPIDPASWFGDFEVQRRLPNGETMPGSAIHEVGDFVEQVGSGGAYAEFSVWLGRDPAGALWLAAPSMPDHVGPVLVAIRLAPDGSPVPGPVTGIAGAGVTLQRVPGGGVLLTAHDPSGPTHAQWDPRWAHVAFRRDGGPEQDVEEVFSPFEPAYTDADAVALPDGGTLVVWGSAFPAPGLRALRFGPDGNPLDAQPVGIGPGGLRLWARGDEVRAAWPAGAPGVLRLHDLQGREVAHRDIDETGGEAVLRLGDGARPGLYFGRLTRRDGTASRARVTRLR